MRPLNEIIVHCSATRTDWMAGKSLSAKVAEIKSWHTDPTPVGRGWRDIGYHYLIDRDGALATGRPLDEVGAHVQGRNTGTIGICLLGGHGSSEKDAFAKNYTPAQDAALRGLIASLRARYPTIKAVTGHNQFAAKACPGFNAPAWYAMASKPVDISPAPVSVAKPGLFALIAKIIAAIFGGRK